MNWIKVDKDWWRGGSGAWIRRVYFTGLEKCKCEKCQSKLLGLKGEYYCGWKDFGLILGYFKTFNQFILLCKEEIEKL